MKTDKNINTIIIGITGATGAGKSTVAGMFQDRGIPVFDADKAVHKLLEADYKDIASVFITFPRVVRNNHIDRGLLARQVFSSRSALIRLESIIYPIVRQEEKIFINDTQQQQAQLAVMEIPLLFESGADKLCDVVICLTAPMAIRWARIRLRSHMTLSRFHAMHRRQISDSIRQRKSDFVVRTDCSLEKLAEKIDNIIITIKRCDCF